MPSFLSKIASRRIVRGSSSINITPALESSVPATPPAFQNGSQLVSQSPAASDLTPDHGVSAPSPLEPHNSSPEPSREHPSPVYSRTPSVHDTLKTADAPGPSPHHSTSSLALSNAPSEVNSPISAELLGSFHASASQSSISVASSSDISSLSETSEISNQYTPSRADVIATRSALLRHFPLEIVEIILSEYYPHSIFAMPRHYFNHPLAVRDVRLQAMLTSPIEDPEFISRVVIRTESHDQGWSSYPQDQGTFNNSWTWLDLALVRNPTESPSTETPPSWRIYTNLHASRTWQSKEVVLDRNHEIIGALKTGDSLAIWAEARYPGWVNVVRSATIEVVYRL